MSNSVHEETWNVVNNADDPYEKGHLPSNTLTAVMLGFQWVIQVDEPIEKSTKAKMSSI